MPLMLRTAMLRPSAQLSAACDEAGFCEPDADSVELHGAIEFHVLTACACAADGGCKCL